MDASSAGLAGFREVNLHCAGREDPRAHANAVEEAVLGTETVEGWQIVSLRLVRRRIVRDVAGPWAAAVDFRARLLKV